MMRDNIIIDL